MKRPRKTPTGQTTSLPPLLEEGHLNKINANFGVRSWRLYRSSTRLPVFGTVARVTLWGGFRLGAEWYSRLERFWQKEDLECHFPREVQAIRYVLRSIVVSPESGWFEGVAKVRQHAAMEAAGMRVCQGMPWSKKLNGKKFHGVAWWQVRSGVGWIRSFLHTSEESTQLSRASTNVVLCWF